MLSSTEIATSPFDITWGYLIDQQDMLTLILSLIFVFAVTSAPAGGTETSSDLSGGTSGCVPVPAPNLRGEFVSKDFGSYEYTKTTDLYYEQCIDWQTLPTTNYCGVQQIQVYFTAQRHSTEPKKVFKQWLNYQSKKYTGGLWTPDGTIHHQLTSGVNYDRHTGDHLIGGQLQACVVVGDTAPITMTVRIINWNT